MHTVIRIFLALAGLVAGGIGASLLLDPVGFEASTGLALSADPHLLSELRAPGAALALGGLFMGLGAVWRRFTRDALALGAAVYSAYGVARLVGFALDGVPNAGLVTAATIELGMGAVALGLLLTSRPLRPTQA